MAIERPVTGSCERCARGHDLLIPVPGSGDLDFQRVVARFSWCAGCGRIVGLTCCWSGPDGLCADCATGAAASESLLTDALLARNAFSGLVAATDAMVAVERRLGRMRVTDERKASNAWEDAWLESGTLIVRADSAVQTGRSRGAAALLTPDDRHWLTDQLATLDARWDEHNRAVADRLERVGLRIRALAALALPSATSAPPPPERVAVPVRVARTLSPVTHLPVREPVPVGARPSAPERRQMLVQPTAAPPRIPVQRVVPAERVRPAQRVPPSQLVVPAQQNALVQPAVPLRRPQPPRPAPLRPAQLPRPAPVSAARTGRGRAGIVSVALLAVIGAALAAAAIDGAAQTSPSPVVGSASSVGSDAGAVTAPFPSANATDAGVAPSASGTIATFDLEPIGPLTAEAAGIERVLGAPEVAALPTPFDRSLLLATSGSGACLAGVPGEPTRSFAVDLRTGTRPEGILQVTPTHRPDESVALDLARIAGLEPEAWYRVELAWADDRRISVEVRERDSGRAVRRGQLPAVADGPDRNGPGAVCLEAMHVSGATDIHIDNVRVGS